MIFERTATRCPAPVTVVVVVSFFVLRIRWESDTVFLLWHYVAGCKCQHISGRPERSTMIEAKAIAREDVARSSIDADQWYM